MQSQMDGLTGVQRQLAVRRTTLQLKTMRSSQREPLCAAACRDAAVNMSE